MSAMLQIPMLPRFFIRLAFISKIKIIFQNIYCSKIYQTLTYIYTYCPCQRKTSLKLVTSSFQHVENGLKMLRKEATTPPYNLSFSFQNLNPKQSFQTLYQS